MPDPNTLSPSSVQADNNDLYHINQYVTLINAGRNRYLNNTPPLLTAISNENGVYCNALRDTLTQDLTAIMSILLKRDEWNYAKEFLMMFPGLVNFKDENGITPLHLAAQMNDERLVSYLIAKGARITQTNNNCTPIQLTTNIAILTIFNTYLQVQMQPSQVVTPIILSPAGINITSPASNGQAPTSAMPLAVTPLDSNFTPSGFFPS